MVYSIAGSMKSLIWTLVLMFLLMYVFSVYLTQLIADSAQQDPEILHVEAALTRYYGSLPRAIISLYQAMTGGVDWNDLLLPLETFISPWLSLLFVFYIAFAVLAMMNVVTGVFVESALLTAKADRDAQVINQVKAILHGNEAEPSCETLTWDGFAKRLGEPGVDKYFTAMDIDIADARGLFLLLDTDESGEVDSEEFIQGCLRLRGPAKSIDVATLLYFNKRMFGWWRTNMQSLGESVDRIIELVEDRHDSPPRSEDDSPARDVHGRSPCGSRRQSDADMPRRRSGSSTYIDGEGEQHLIATWSELKAAGQRRALEPPELLKPGQNSARSSRDDRGGPQPGVWTSLSRSVSPAGPP